MRGRRRHAGPLAGHRPCAPWSIQSWSRRISASLSGGRFRGIRSPSPSPRNGEDQRALLAVARHDRRSALAPLEGGRGRIEPEPAARLAGPVTCHAVPGQERLDLTGIVNLRRDDRDGGSSTARAAPQTSTARPIASHDRLSPIVCGAGIREVARVGGVSGRRSINPVRPGGGFARVSRPDSRLHHHTRTDRR